jgi:hypothetical protein
LHPSEPATRLSSMNSMVDCARSMTPLPSTSSASHVVPASRAGGAAGGERTDECERGEERQQSHGGSAAMDGRRF